MGEESVMTSVTEVTNMSVLPENTGEQSQTGTLNNNTESTDVSAMEIAETENVPLEHIEETAETQVPADAEMNNDDIISSIVAEAVSQSLEEAGVTEEAVQTEEAVVTVTEYIPVTEAEETVSEQPVVTEAVETAARTRDRAPDRTFAIVILSVGIHKHQNGLHISLAVGDVFHLSQKQLNVCDVIMYFAGIARTVNARLPVKSRHDKSAFVAENGYVDNFRHGLRLQ